MEIIPVGVLDLGVYIRELQCVYAYMLFSYSIHQAHAVSMRYI